ncbi:hypothetical protein [Chitinophaga filiformis]|uniref:Helix-turn-helix domain-containing protein n=1 Tax=Chitinophaga filiformis TaxID=104663 RepID=A0ABY4HVB5_CHIFI|nr:hypothetical protein [Chitinophaga filiformis]UPK67335.1 hypothetical protein MYF79_20555 [Chitinophaga filiformis]
MNKQYAGVNFIRHLNAFYTLVHEHERLRANDISLYVALFHLWNLAHFPGTLMVDRSLVVQLSKIGSLRTYLQCMKRLHDFGFLTYHPSERPFLRCAVKMVPLEKKAPQSVKTAPHTAKKSDPHMRSNKDPGEGGNCAPHTGAILLHFNNNKQINNFINESKTARAQKKSKDKIIVPAAPELEEICAYFRSAAQSDKEAGLFYFHYKAIGWTLSGMPILDWKAAAEKWISRIPSLKNNAIANTTSTTGGLESAKDKRYDDPL